MNLDSLKQELLDYITSQGFAVFRGQVGLLESHDAVLWDTEEHPDYHAFLEVAKNAGVRVIVLAHREFSSAEIDDAFERMQECELPREEFRSIERNLSDLRTFAGSTCTVEMAFDYQGRMYVFGLVTDWFENFVDISDLLLAASVQDEDDGKSEPGGAFGGYYSKN